MSAHLCRESRNPRQTGTCDCGKRLPPSPPGRSAHYEQEFLTEAATAAERRHGTPADNFVERVLNRLDHGATLYGDNAFLNKDMIRELLEETPDVASHAVLEAQKMIASGEDDEESSMAWHLFECAVHAAAADYHARQAKVIARERHVHTKPAHGG